MQQQPRVQDGPNLQLDFQIPTQNQGLICARGERERSVTGGLKHEGSTEEEVPTDGDASSLSGEVRPGLQRVLEARHRPLAVRRVSCRGFVQRQVSDATDEST